MGESLYRKTGEFAPDRLVADNAIPLTSKGITVAAGQGFLKRGTLMGPDSNGRYRMSGSKEILGDGENSSEREIGCDCILTDDTDTASDAVASAYVTGCFDAAAIVLAEGADIKSYETDLRKLGIFLKAVQEY